MIKFGILSLCVFFSLLASADIGDTDKMAMISDTPDSAGSVSFQVQGKPAIDLFSQLKAGKIPNSESCDSRMVGDRAEIIQCESGKLSIFCTRFVKQSKYLDGHVCTMFSIGR